LYALFCKKLARLLPTVPYPSVPLCYLLVNPYVFCMEACKNKAVYAVDISFNNFYEGGMAEAESTVSLRSIQLPGNLTDVCIHVIWNSIVESISREFKLNAAVTISFDLLKAKLNAKAIFDCICFTEKHLQEVVAKIFAGKSYPVIAPVPYEEVKDTIEEHLGRLS
jgi:hypothetical protein